MPTTFFGRTESNGRRRLGDDFDLIAKWLSAAIHMPTRSSYLLSQFSAADQRKFLTEPACEFRIDHGPDNTVKVEMVDGEKTELDPEVEAMLFNDNYQRGCAKHLDLFTAMEDASPEADVIEAAEYERSISEGLDIEAAKQRAEAAFKRHVDKATLRVVVQWRLENLRRKKRLGQDIVFVDGDNPRLALRDTLTDDEFSKVPMTDAKPVANAHAATHSSPKIKMSFDRTPGAGRPVQRTPEKASSSTSSSPTHGSETSVPSLSYSSPRSSSDESSPKLVSTPRPGGWLTTQAEHLEGASIGAFDGGSQHTTAQSQSMYGHLGSGLTKAFLDGTFVAPSGFQAINNSLFISNQKTNVYGGGVALGTPAQPLCDNANYYSAYNQYNQFNQFSPGGGNIMAPQSAPYGNFKPLQPVPETTAPTVCKYPPPPPLPKAPTPPKRAKYQPWSGMTCYEMGYPSSPDFLVPEYWTTRDSKTRYLHHKIHNLVQEDVDLRLKVTHRATCEPIHVFVDLSNIIIGFYDCLKMKRSIDIRKRVKTPAFSFENFDAVLCRGRDAAKRVVAGSLGSSNKRRPEYMVEAETLGYEMNILQRVPKPVSPQLRKKSKGGRDVESATSGPESSGDDNYVGPKKNGEQGVDELLHLKILQSALDTSTPATMVLATGDAAHAEFSDGFKSNIERVLAFGWYIELYGWSRNISSAWRDEAWTSRWGKRFRIIELDQFAEELYDIAFEPLQR